MTYSATILIVDDDATNRNSLALLLQDEGYATLSAANGKEALAIVAQNPPDLILLDVVMGDSIDGYDVAASLKANPATASIPIIMVTGQGGRGALVVALNAGAEGFVPKPIDMPVLSLRIRNLLRLAQATPVHDIPQIAHS